MGQGGGNEGQRVGKEGIRGENEGQRGGNEGKIRVADPVPVRSGYYCSLYCNVRLLPTIELHI